jgi:hypothetical protein
MIEKALVRRKFSVHFGCITLLVSINGEMLVYLTISIFNFGVLAQGSVPFWTTLIGLIDFTNPEMCSSEK